MVAANKNKLFINYLFRPALLKDFISPAAELLAGLGWVLNPIYLIGTLFFAL
jgi:hypothetical protein